jgi:S1-C subfamily serine protease
MKNKVKVILFSIIILLLSSILVFEIYDFLKSDQKIYKNSLKSIVEVKATTSDLESFGSAVFIFDKELITNYHIVSYIRHSDSYIHEKIYIRFADSTNCIEAEVKKYDQNLDLAILSINVSVGKLISVSKSKINVGDEVLVVGNGNNLGISLTKGVINKEEVEIEIDKNVNKYIQVDATLTNGVSGGALLDSNGRIVGVITLRLLDKEGKPIYGYVYAIPINIVIDFINK